MLNSNGLDQGLANYTLLAKSNPATNPSSVLCGSHYFKKKKIIIREFPFNF